MPPVVAAPPAACEVSAPVAKPAKERVPVYRLDLFCVKLWIAGAAILIALHGIDTLARLFGHWW
jgi:hypothetical protein